MRCYEKKSANQINKVFYKKKLQFLLLLNTIKLLNKFNKYKTFGLIKNSRNYLNWAVPYSILD